MAAVELRDTGVPIVDIALKYGFSDQTTFTRSFKSVYGCAPSAYRKWPKPLPLVCKKMLLEPFKKKEGETDMGNLSKPYVHLEYIPAHKYLGIYKRFVTGEGEIWPGHDCDLGCGIISSFKEEELDLIVTRFTAGWTGPSSAVATVNRIPLQHRKNSLLRLFQKCILFAHNDPKAIKFLLQLPMSETR